MLNTLSLNWQPDYDVFVGYRISETITRPRSEARPHPGIGSPPSIQFDLDLAIIPNNPGSASKRRER